MGNNTVFSALRKRRLQRWLRQEALDLAREANMFGCSSMDREARRLLAVTC